MSSGITGHKGLKVREVMKGELGGVHRVSTRSKVSSEESEERTKALRNCCRVFIEMVFTQVRH